MKSIDESDCDANERCRFLVFRIEQQRYALPAETVAEVIRVPTMARVPQSPRALVGVANLRGSVLPVASLRALLGMDDGLEDRDGCRAIVMQEQPPFAVLVDRIDQLTTVRSGDIETKVAGLSTEAGGRLTGAFFTQDGRASIKILDLAHLVSDAFSRRKEVKIRSKAFGAEAVHRGVKDVARHDTLITFDIAGQEFAFDIDVVQEVVEVPKDIAIAPRADTATVGIIAFRDQLLPVLSLRQLLGFAPARSSEGWEKIVVTLVGGSLVGLLVDRARAALRADPELIETIPSLLAARSGGEARVRSIYRGDSGRRMVQVLAPELLFLDDVMKGLKGDDQNAARERAAVSGEQKFLIFRLGGDEFGLSIGAVVEVIRVPDQITRVPKTPKFLEGVISFRGEVLPLIDQRRRFEMPMSERLNARRVIVIQTEMRRAGLIVDDVLGVVSATPDDIEPTPDLTADMNRLVGGVLNLESESRIILLLAPIELLTQTERKLLDAFDSRMRAST